MTTLEIILSTFLAAALVVWFFDSVSLKDKIRLLNARLRDEKAHTEIIRNELHQREQIVPETEVKTLRDDFAISVISEIIRVVGQHKFDYGGCENILRNNCDSAYKIANAMIDARKRNLKNHQKQYDNENN